jgi:hypothetical protein
MSSGIQAGGTMLDATDTETEDIEGALTLKHSMGWVSFND